MSEFTNMLDRINIRHIATYLLYGTEPTSDIADSFDERIAASYTELWEKLEKSLPSFDTDDMELQDIMADFALVHSDVYLQAGVLIGFQLYKVLEQGYSNPQLTGLDSLLKKYMDSVSEP